MSAAGTAVAEPLARLSLPIGGLGSAAAPNVATAEGRCGMGPTESGATRVSAIAKSKARDHGRRPGWRKRSSLGASMHTRLRGALELRQGHAAEIDLVENRSYFHVEVIP